MAGAGLREIIGTAERVGQSVQEGAIPLGVTRHEGHGLRSVAGLDPIEPHSDGGDRLVPGNGFELARSTGSSPAHRRADTVLPVDVLTVGRAFGTQGSIIGRKAGSSLHLDHYAVLYIGVYTTLGTRSTDITHGMTDFDARLRARDFGMDQLLQFTHSCHSPPMRRMNARLSPPAASSPCWAGVSRASPPSRRFVRWFFKIPLMR